MANKIVWPYAVDVADVVDAVVINGCYYRATWTTAAGTAKDWPTQEHQCFPGKPGKISADERSNGWTGDCLYNSIDA